MILGSIDIGSNAVRLQITSVVGQHPHHQFKRVEYVRFPLRLGQDVFQSGAVSEPLADKFVRLMQAYRILLDLYQVADYMACATSALREATNGRALADRVRVEAGVDIKIIDGNQEADLINQAIHKYLDERCYLHIDVGGGSTELTFYINYKPVASESFKIGSVRSMNGQVDTGAWVMMDDWLQRHVISAMQVVTAIGTGGNIGKLFELSQTRNKKLRLMTLQDLIQTQQEVAALSVQERMDQLMLNPDRADVIVPASEIYLHVMRMSGAKRIQVPDVGLKDGIIELLYEKNRRLRPSAQS